jgi:hypothetical protein
MVIDWRIIRQKITSSDGKRTAIAQSMTSAAGDGEIKINHDVTVKIDSGNSYSSSSSASSSASSFH